jgi:hypothetical protein
MRTNTPPTRWTSIRKARRLVARWRSGRRHRASSPIAWAPHEFGLGAENPPPAPEHFPTRSGASGSEPVPPAFVELFPPLPLALPECTIECEQPSGTKMTISLRGAHGADLLALVQSLSRAEQ